MKKILKIRLATRPHLILILVFLSASSLSCGLSRSFSFSHAQVQNEFDSILPPPWAVKVEDVKIRKTSGGLVGAYYSTDRSFSEVSDYYDKHLADKGYKRLEKKSVKTLSGADYGEHTINYCKGRLMAELYDPGKSVHEISFQYSFNVSVGALECR